MRVKVTLAEAPTDVLVWLAERPGRPFSCAEIAKAVAPPDSDAPLSSTRMALKLLAECGYVVERVEDRRFEVTAEGRGAVVEAMTQAKPEASEPAKRSTVEGEPS